MIKPMTIDGEGVIPSSRPPVPREDADLLYLLVQVALMSCTARDNGRLP